MIVLDDEPRCDDEPQGRGFAVGALPTKLAPDRQYYINVYTSAQQRDTPIACGAITN